MNTFSNLIAAGVALGPGNGQVLPDKPQADQICRTYNNIWGVATDTNMFVDVDGNRVIVGKRFLDNEWISSLLYCRMIAGTLVDCKSSGYDCLNAWLDSMGLTIELVDSPLLGRHAVLVTK